MKRSEATWDNSPSIVYEAGGSRVVVVPTRGGKIVSMCGADGRDWLIPLREGADTGPHLGFEDAEMCGWDECAPSIDACISSSGASIPDHGELWSQPWRTDPDSDRLSAGLPSIGATFSRTVSIDGDGRIRLDYEVCAGAEPFAFLWAAHPQFAVDPADLIVLLGDAVLPWDVSDAATAPAAPVAPAAEEQRRSVFSLSEVPAGGSRKLYADPFDGVPGASIVRPNGARMTMTWDPALLPYLGIWCDRAEFAARETVAIEPSTGWYDSVERAASFGRVRHIAARARFTWWIEVALDVGPDVTPLLR